MKRISRSLSRLAIAAMIAPILAWGAGQEQLDKALCKAAKRGDAEEVSSLLDGGARPMARCANGYSPLQVHFFYGKRLDPRLTRAFLEAGAEPDQYGLLCFAISGSGARAANAVQAREVVTLLLDYGADPESPTWGDRCRGHANYLAMAESEGSPVAEIVRGAAKLSPAARKAHQLRRRAKADAEAKLAERIGAIEEMGSRGDEARRAGKPKEALDHYIAALKETPPGTDKDHDLREKVIKTALSMKAAPALSEESKLHAERAQAFLKRAEGIGGYERAVSELEKASALAPWWAPVYFNLGLVREKAGDLEGAVRSLKLYLLAAPGAGDAESVRKKIVDLEVGLEMQR